MIEIRHPRMDATRDTESAYDAIYSDKGIAQRDSFYLWLLELVAARPGQSLLDVSCGQGTLVDFAARAGLRASGLDFSMAALERAQRRAPANGFFAADAEQLPLPSATFDRIMNIGSLEHYQHPEAGLREMARVLKPDGMACVLLPNAYGLFGNIKHVLQTGDVFDDGQPLQRYHTRTGWHAMLEVNGLTPFETIKYEREWPRTRADLGWYLRRPAKIVRLLITPLIPLNFANCLVYLCRRGKRW